VIAIREDRRAFLLLLVGVSLAFVWILRPFAGAILWGMTLAIVFAPLQRRILPRVGGRRSLAALATLLTILVIVVIPVGVVIALLIQQAVALYTRIGSGELNVGDYVQRIVDAMPPWAANLVERFAPADLSTVQERVSGLLTGALQFLGSQALNLGQNTLAFVLSTFVMLYLLFFLLRDGEALAARIRAAVPLSPDRRDSLARRFTVVIRATIKGSLIVSVVQGTLGGLMFWALGIPAAVLWGALMALFALLPAVGPAVVWIPFAVYLIAVGAFWKGVGLAVYGIVVIGLVDNLLRPMLVGRDTRMPDYLVLISTLGGIAVFGLNGFIIGPVIAAMFMAVWELFASDRAEAAAALRRAEDRPVPVDHLEAIEEHHDQREEGATSAERQVSPRRASHADC
jgi:predicted PurR-regulated permease PerM